MNILDKLLDYIFPPVCGICGIINEKYICDSCYYEIKKLEISRIIKNNSKYYSSYLYLFKYEGMIRDKIIDYKFNDKSYLYSTFVEILLRNQKCKRYIKSFDIIIPVPISNKRMKERGYNQCELITKEISKKLNIQTDSKLIRKSLDNKPQSSLNKTERIDNVKNVYSINTEKTNLIKNTKVLIFDDIYTTGSTVNEISRVLKQNGASDIGILTISKD